MNTIGEFANFRPNLRGIAGVRKNSAVGAGRQRTLSALRQSPVTSVRYSEIYTSLSVPHTGGNQVTKIGLMLAATLALLTMLTQPEPHAAGKLQRRLYVASPGVRDYTEYGGVGVLVFDIGAGHRWVKRIPTPQIQNGSTVENVKGICASAKTARLYVSTIQRLLCLDLLTDKVLWNRSYEGGCDRMSISPDGKTIYLPTLEKDDWHVVDAGSGDVIATISPKSGAHNTVYGPDGKEVYLAGLRSPFLSVADTRTHTITRTVGPFSAPVRPLTVNGGQTLCFVNVNELLGFEIGDLRTGKKLHRVEVQGCRQGSVKRHGCPSHGIGLTPDEKELWLSDAANQRVHVFDATVMPPKQVTSIKLREQPGWVTFSIDGQHAYPSTGEVIDTKTKRIIAALADEAGRPVHSEKLLEIDFRDGKPARTGDQFGIGGNR
jgi:DNA-binding beta-propeller fold protein YncE